MRKSQSLQVLPLPSSHLHREEGLAVLIPNATLTTGTPEPRAVLGLPIVSSGSWEKGRGLGLPQAALGVTLGKVSVSLASASRP